MPHEEGKDKNSITIEGPEGRTEELDLVQRTNVLWDDATLKWLPRRSVFDSSWQLFWNQYDFSRKAEWQSKNFVPKLNRMVRQAAYAFKDAILTTRQYFAVDGVGLQSKARAWIPAKIVRMWLDKAKFPDKFTDSVFGALLSSLMIFKVYWESYVEEEVSKPTKLPNTGMGNLAAAMDDQATGPQGEIPDELKTRRRVKSRLRIDVIDPYKFRMDPTGRKKFCIHEYEMDLHDLVELARNPSNGYDLETVLEIQEDFHNFEQKQREASRQNQLATPTAQQMRKQVVLKEYWGEIWTDSGRLVGRNMTYTIVNNKWLIRKPMKNPYFSKRLPFAWGAPLRVPFSNWHQSFAENLNGLQRMMTEIFNLTMDSNLWSSIKAFEVDLDQVVDPNELRSGIYPGKTLKKRSRGIPRQMLTAVELGITNPQNLAFFNQIDREGQNASGVTEFSAGFVGGRKTELATEIRTKSAQSFSYLGSIAREIEEGVLNDLLEMVWELVLNFQDDFNDEQLREALGDETTDLLLMLDDEGRKEMLAGKFKFKFSGITRVLDRQRDIQKLQLLIQMLRFFPQAAQAMKIPAVVRRFFDTINWDPEEFLSKQFLASDIPQESTALTPSDEERRGLQAESLAEALQTIVQGPPLQAGQTEEGGL